MPKTTEDLLAYLDTLGIQVTTTRHPPLFTVADSQSLRGEIQGGHTKKVTMNAILLMSFCLVRSTRPKSFPAAQKLILQP